MDLQTAIKGALRTRDALRSKQGVSNPTYISENMQRLTQYTAGIEEHLALLEEQLEVDEMTKFINYTKVEGRSINQAEILAKQEVGALKGEIAKLKRYVNSSWQVVSVAQSRINHLTQEYRMGAKTT